MMLHLASLGYTLVHKEDATACKLCSGFLLMRVEETQCGG